MAHEVDRVEVNGRPLNPPYSVGWLAFREYVMAGLDAPAAVPSSPTGRAGGLRARAVRGPLFLIARGVVPITGTESRIQRQTSRLVLASKRNRTRNCSTAPRVDLTNRLVPVRIVQSHEGRID